MRPSRRLHLIPILLFLGLALLLGACNADAMRVAPREATSTPMAAPTATFTPTPIPTPTPTPIPPLFLPAEDRPTPTPASGQEQTKPGAGACTNRILFLSDVTIPDGMKIQPGAAFIKTWRLKNVGTCPWSPQHRLVFVRGERMGGPESQPLGKVVKPGAQVDISVKLIAPEKAGAYTGEWMLETPGGERFGLGDDGQTPFWLKIVVPAP